MSKWLIAGLLAALSLPCCAARRVTVAQLEQRITAAVAAHKADAEMARQIGQTELSERISRDTLRKLDQRVARDSRTVLALRLLADVSSFLPLPADELPALPAPDQPTQERELESARDYAFRMLPRLPNLLATRTTYSFDDSPQEEEKGAWVQRAGLHQIAASKAEVSVLEERQRNLPAKESDALHAQKGLVTWGEFGSTLLLVVNDTAGGTIQWSHWEPSAVGPISVFDYSVPKAASHYQVATPTEKTKHIGGSGSGRWWSAGGGGSEDATSASSVARSNAAYHGSLWIDPVSGTILRVTLIVDLRGNPVLESGAILVEYGPVRIENQTFICPLRSLALSSAPGSVTATLNGAATEWLNENVFAGYHLFGSTSRILTDEADSSTGQMPAAVTDSETSSSHPAEEGSGTNALQAMEAPQPTAESPAADSAVRAPDATASAPAPEVPAAPSAAPTAPVSPSAPTTAAPASASAPDAEAPGAPTFRINTNSVLVPVIVRDGKGSSIDDLHKEDFAVFDDGKARNLSGFLLEKRGGEQDAKGSSPAAPEGTSSVPHTQPSLPSRITIFVFDDMDMGAEDIIHARLAMSKVLDEAVTASDVAAVVTTSGKVNSGLTRDRSALDKALLAIRPVLIYRPDATDCPQISYYQADQILNKHSEPALQDVIGQIRTICVPKAPHDKKKQE